MRGSAPQTPEYRTNLIALPLIGSIRLVGQFPSQRVGDAGLQAIQCS
jgi:hypothetical protein